MNSLSIDFLQASTQSKRSHVKSHAGLHKCFLFMEQPRGYHGKFQELSMDFLFREFFTLPRGPHGKSQILPLTFSSQGIHTARKSHGKSKDFPYDSVSWRPLHRPEDASRIPRISHGVSFYRGLYTVQSPLEVQIGWMSQDIHTIYHFQISYQRMFYSITRKGTDDCVPSVFSHCENSLHHKY